MILQVLLELPALPGKLCPYSPNVTNNALCYDKFWVTDLQIAKVHTKWRVRNVPGLLLHSPNEFQSG